MPRGGHVLKTIIVIVFLDKSCEGHLSCIWAHVVVVWAHLGVLLLPFGLILGVK